MLAKRIIPCLDVKDNKVVKGVKFRNHVVLGDIVDFANFYQNAGADELVFYDITASSENRLVSKEWVTTIARVLDIPFCVAGGIKTVSSAEIILASGADKISINSPALEKPLLIRELANEFGSQCVVVGIDTSFDQDNYYVYQYTGVSSKTIKSKIPLFEWVQIVQDLGAGEIVLNCMAQDGTKKGYAVELLRNIKSIIKIPLIASGGAGSLKDFKDVFQNANVDGALAAGVFHEKSILIPDLKKFLYNQAIEVRL